MRILILTESGEGIGFGHISRMSALKNYLEERKCEVKFIVNDLSKNGKINGYYNWIENREWLSALNDFDIVIIDSYLAPSSMYTNIKDLKIPIVAIDDFNRTVYDVDVIINPNVFIDALQYSNQTAMIYGGKDYVLLRKPFWKNRLKEKMEIKYDLLIALGGSDYRELLPILANLSCNFERVAVICPEEERKIILIDKFPKAKVFGLLNEDEMVDIYESSDVVISGCGQSLHELFFLEKKTIGICIDQDQVLNQDFYLAYGFLLERLNWNKEELVKRVLKQFKKLKVKNNISSMIRLKFDPEKNMTNYMNLFFLLKTKKVL